MGPNGSQQILIGPKHFFFYRYEYNIKPERSKNQAGPKVGPIGSHWVPRGPKRSQWVSKGPKGSQWVPMGPTGSQWISMGSRQHSDANVDERLQMSDYQVIPNGLQ